MILKQPSGLWSWKIISYFRLAQPGDYSLANIKKLSEKNDVFLRMLKKMWAKTFSTLKIKYFSQTLKFFGVWIGKKN